MNSITIPTDIQESWQKTLNLMAQLLDVKVSMITRVSRNGARVRVLNESESNPFHVKESISYKKDALCRRSIDVDGLVFVESLDDEHSEHDMKCYLGKPLHWPNGSAYGTLSLMDDRPRTFGPEQMAVFEQLHQLTEYQLQLVNEIDQHKLTRGALSQFQQQHKEVISRDSLTGAYNRRSLQELAVAELSRATRYSSSFALVVFDVDHFKQINDQYGHSAGDAVLKHMVSSLQSKLRQSDFIARLSSEEFCLLLPEMNPDSAHDIVDRLRKHVASEPVVFKGEQIYFTVSCGYSLFEGGMITTVEELLNMAETALGEAKQTGRNRVCMATMHSYEEAMYSAL